jgi:hypothetical protein
MFLVAVTALGVFYGWLRLRTDSVWPAVLAHSAHNVAVAWMSSLVVGNAVAIQYIAGEGAVTTAAYVAIAVGLLMRANDPGRQPAATRPTAPNWHSRSGSTDAERDCGRVDRRSVGTRPRHRHRA